jgi:ketosteroid isomerase-like protein
MSRSFADILEGGLTAFARGDIPAVQAMFHEDIVWRVPGTNVVAGTYTGLEEVGEFFMRLRELSGGTIKLTPTEIFDNGSGIVLVMCSVTGERGGRRAAFDVIQAWRFEDAKAKSCQYYNADQAAVDAFWS